MTLSRRDLVVLDTLLPGNADPILPLGAGDIGFASFHAEFERSATPFMRRAFRAALFAATWVAPLLVHGAPPLSRHSRDRRERALEAMATSRITILGQLLALLKIVAAMAYGADARVREAVGYGRRYEPPTAGPG